MKNHLTLILTLFVTECLYTYSQTYISPQQKTTTGSFANRVETKSPKKVIIDKNSFHLELPDGGELSGTMTFWKKIELDDEVRIMYEIDGGGLISINDDLIDDYDHIFVNLMGTETKKTYTYWLTAGNKGDD